MAALHGLLGSGGVTNRIIALLLRLLPSRRASLVRGLRGLEKGAGSQTILDVGAGDGTFVDTLNRLGWDAEGIEVDQTAVERAQKAGRRVSASELRDLSTQGRRYDLITLNHVIEHVDDPCQLLVDCVAVLSEGGSIWCATPNGESYGARVFGPNWVHLDPPRHRVIFTERSLRGCFHQSGLTSDSIPTQAYASPSLELGASLGLVVGASRLGAPWWVLVFSRIAAPLWQWWTARATRRYSELVMTGRLSKRGTE
ncbi:class I SAM-dependent methyltransferase [Thermoleophilia bacterium SCSIO 60948]|nr:class I SAM-dependent methyltransferase [Thermoleophilia bacterium SCSIO 60948]